MSYDTYKDDFKLDPRLQKQVDMGDTGTDILHGELKNLMYECETKLVDTPLGEEYKYLEGRMDALTDVYIMTYNLAFAINERAKLRG